MCRKPYPWQKCSVFTKAVFVIILENSFCVFRKIYFLISEDPSDRKTNLRYNIYDINYNVGSTVNEPPYDKFATSDHFD